MKHRKQNSLPQDFDEEFSDDYAKTRVECICPKCGKHHKIQFHWSGKGTPRKYCKKCRCNLEQSTP